MLDLRKFEGTLLWGGGALEKSPNIVNWKLVCADKEEGGLGIHSLVLLNKALLEMWG